MLKTDWLAWCRNAKDIACRGGDLIVRLQTGRSQRVAVQITEETLEFTSIVARTSALNFDDDLHMRVWRRNRSVQGVGFGVDNKDRVVARAWMPMVGATKDEFLECLRHLAAEADLFEYQLTGKDRG